ncbi:hypothetical protein SAMN03080617_02955 [Algoriphagus alkaliphilus]|uniref:Seryl-tRNA synthetase n=1 Tax=Algoriphagus alkaliphilus TaxID=279824 RepID=A0A1G5YXN8_9BACT|nr:hypothetical protein [Algoriphagus alkaliphilus]MBA4300972.1 hypothetical protein [Cyclobacterium sp.]SDA87266.1 hypothetical protein SAMN03080617_02955 [Algoriphagus alkaliphilus]
MKKLLAVLAIFVSVQFANATPEKNPKIEPTAAQKVRLAEMEERLEEIKALDFKSMSKDEIKSIRTEMKEMKAEAKRAGNGIYISVGAIIIILLILLLI